MLLSYKLATINAINNFRRKTYSTGSLSRYMNWTLPSTIELCEADYNIFTRFEAVVSMTWIMISARTVTWYPPPPTQEGLLSFLKSFVMGTLV